MDMTPTHTTSNSTKSPEPESETPTRAIPVKPFSFTNGVLKRHAPLHHHHPAAVVTYRECQKNHAASMGGHALDGCGEFMPSPDAIATDPTSIKCAACGCHRNFHRREPEDAPPTPIAATHIIEYQPHHRHHPPPPPPPRSPSSASPPPISSSYYPHAAAAAAPHVLLALSTAAAPESAHLPSGAMIGPSSSRKRFRTKFSQTQKDRMFEFAERVAWKIQKRDEELIREFCNEIGVERGVLKVWMHNNKNTLGKKLPENADNNNGHHNSGAHPDSYPTSSGGGASDVVPMVKTEFNGGERNGGHHNHHHHHHLLHVGTNGSSSSS